MKKELTTNRIIQYANYKGISVSSFEKSLGKAPSYLRNTKDVTSGVLQKLMDIHPDLSIDWVITGEGNMLKSIGESTAIKPEEQISLVPKGDAVNYKLVPLLNLDAVGGMHSTNSEVGDSEFINKLIPFTDAQEGDVALMVSGESMSPTCPSGSKVLIREVPQWNEYFGYGNIFVLLLTDGRRILKEVQKYTEDSKNYILCRSHNDRYPEEELPKSMIAGVWKVIKILNERGW